MLGAIIGDIIDSRWEFNPTNDYSFLGVLQFAILKNHKFCPENRLIRTDICYLCIEGKVMTQVYVSEKVAKQLRSPNMCLKRRFG